MICDISNLGSIGVAAIGAVFYLNYDSLLDFLIKDATMCVPSMLSPMFVSGLRDSCCVFLSWFFSDFIFSHVVEFEDGDAPGLSYRWSLDSRVFLYIDKLCNL